MSPIRRRFSFVLAFSAVCMTSVVQGQISTGSRGKSGGGGMPFSPELVRGWTQSINNLFASKAPDLATLNSMLSTLNGVDLTVEGRPQALAPVYAAVQSQTGRFIAAAEHTGAQAARPNATLATKYIALNILGKFQPETTRSQVAELSLAHYAALSDAEKAKIQAQLATLKMKSIAEALGQTSVDAAGVVSASDSTEKKMPPSGRLRSSDLRRMRSVPEIGSVDVLSPPPFTLKDILPAFASVGARYLDVPSGEFLLDPKGRTILHFWRDSKGGVDRLYSPRSPEELSRLLIGLQEDRYRQADVYLRSVLNLPEPSGRNATEQASPARRAPTP